MNTPRLRSCLFFGLVLSCESAGAAGVFVSFGSHSSGPGIGFSLARFDTDAGVLTQPAFFLEAKEPAFFILSPDGRFLYATNRGQESLVVGAIDPDDGHLTPIQHISSAGNTPRNFAFDPTGKGIICTNYDSAVVFRVDKETGRLTQTGEPVSVRSPLCERILPLP